MNSRERIFANLIFLFALLIPVMAQVSNPNLITMENKISFGASSTSPPFSDVSNIANELMQARWETINEKERPWMSINWETPQEIRELWIVNKATPYEVY